MKSNSTLWFSLRTTFSILLLTVCLSVTASAAVYKVTLVALKNSDGNPEHDLYFKVIADGKTTKIPERPGKDCHFIIGKYATEDLSDRPGIWNPSNQKPEVSDFTFRVENSLEVSLWDYNGLFAAGVDGNKGFINIDLKPGTYSLLLKPLNFRSDMSGGLLATQYTLNYTVTRISDFVSRPPVKGNYQVTTSGGAARLKMDASDRARTIITLSNGEWVNFVSQTGDWRLIKVVSTKKVGWLKRSQLGEYYSR